MFAAVNIMAMLQGTPVVKPFEKIGRRTLPVFLMHIPILSMIAIVADQFLDADPGLPWQPVIATAIAAALCLGLYRLILRAGGGWLFKRADWFVRLTTPTSAPATPGPVVAPRTVEAGRGNAVAARRDHEGERR